MIDPVDGTIAVELPNPGASPASFTSQIFPAVSSNQGWYDLTVTTTNDAGFVCRLAGHVENGSFSVTSATTIVGNPYNTSTTNNVPTSTATNAVGPIIGSINDEVNYLIARNGLATAGTNSLTLTFGSYGGNCALIYPGWASNCVVESSASLAPGSWTPVNAGFNVVSNCNVIILLETNTGVFFRL